MENEKEQWLRENLASWDARVAVHAKSDFYDLQGFLAGRSTLEPYEPALLGDVSGLDLVHLQCHFGLDSLSWARLGARVTGLDFSPAAIHKAREIAELAGLDARFVEAEVYQAKEHLQADYDIVYTGLGAICWLPDLDSWAKVVADLLRPGGRLCLTEFHPFTNLLAGEDLKITESYFGDGNPWREDWSDSYADPSANFAPSPVSEWPHPIAEVITALLGAGLEMQSFAEYDSICCKFWPFLIPADEAFHRFTMPEGSPRLPLEYSLVARKAS
ncbi:MAG: class I SAM-dependent methyltransferase [Actinomycetota bacterium]